MVYACAFWPISVRDKMKSKYGFTGRQLTAKLIDSKQLKEEDRDRLFEEIKAIEHTELGYFTTVLMADYLSNTMLAEDNNGGKNLNKISHDTAIDLINKVKACGVRVKRVILDTVGPPHKYK